MEEKKLTRAQVLSCNDYGLAITLARVGKFLEERGIPYVFSVDVSSGERPAAATMQFMPPADSGEFVDPLLTQISEIMSTPSEFADLTPVRLEAAYGAEHPDIPRGVWRAAVVGGETLDGYWAWVSSTLIAHQKEAVVGKVGEMLKNMFG